MRNQKAELVTKKYEVITREYDSQNKSFDSKHKQIMAEEEQRKKDIVANFEAHVKNIREQMESERTAPDRIETKEETKSLTEKYKEMEIEVTEKIGKMKEAGESIDMKNIDEEMRKLATAQIEEIEKNATFLRGQATLKEKEEEELLRVLKDYRSKFNEFEKAAKKSTAN